MPTLLKFYKHHFFVRKCLGNAANSDSPDSVIDDTVRCSNVGKCVRTRVHVKADSSATSLLSATTADLDGIKSICCPEHFDGIDQLLAVASTQMYVSLLVLLLL